MGMTCSICCELYGENMSQGSSKKHLFIVGSKNYKFSTIIDHEKSHPHVDAIKIYRTHVGGRIIRLVTVDFAFSLVIFLESNPCEHSRINILQWILTKAKCVCFFHIASENCHRNDKKCVCIFQQV
jgi:hypothetical protein